VNYICRDFVQETNSTPDELLQKSKWIQRDENRVFVVGYKEYNLRLFHNWAVGKLGGRPSRKKGDNNPMDNPVLNPAETLGVTLPKPCPNPRPNPLYDMKYIIGYEGVRGASLTALRWLDNFLDTDERFEKLRDKETGLKLLAEFINGRQKMPAAKRIHTEDAIRLMLLDAIKAINLGGERLLCDMLAESIKSSAQGWWFHDKAVRLSKGYSA